MEHGSLCNAINHVTLYAFVIGDSVIGHRAISGETAIFRLVAINKLGFGRGQKEIM